MRRLLSERSVDPVLTNAVLTNAVLTDAAPTDPAPLDQPLLDHTPPAEAMPGQHVLDQPLALHPRVALRPEPFGALAYHYDTRRLNFLRSHDLVALVRSLSDHPSARAAFEATDIGSARWPSYSKALEALVASDFIEPRLNSGSPTEPQEPA